MNFRSVLTAAALCSLLFLVTVAGCGTAAENAMQRQINLMDLLADTIEKGGDQEAIGKIQEQLTANAKEIQELDLPPEEMKRLGEKYQEEFKRVFKRLGNSMINNPLNFGKAFDAMGGFNN